jgi:DNA transformation protein
MPDTFQDLLEELFAPVGGVTIKRMFGGQGVFKQGRMFGLVSQDVLYFKADELTVPNFEREGSSRWTYEMRSRERALPYWRAPDRLLDDPDEFAAWAREAFAAAMRGLEKHKTAKPRSRTTSGSKAKATAKRLRPLAAAKKKPAKHR